MEINEVVVITPHGMRYHRQRKGDETRRTHCGIKLRIGYLYYPKQVAQGWPLPFRPCRRCYRETKRGS